MNELRLLGKKCKDRVSGFEGICIAVVEWMYGCSQFILQPECTDVNKKAHTALFFEKQLIISDTGGLEDIELPAYTEPELFGKECMDKVTRQKGICIGRVIWLYSCNQYVLEHQPEDPDKDAKLMWLDEGRLEEIIGSPNNVDPVDVQSTRPGGVLDYSCYPAPGRDMAAIMQR